MGPQRVVYYAVDNYQAYWPERAAAVCAQENALIDAAGATVAASLQLAAWFRERVPSAAAKIHYVANGVSPDMLASPEAIRAGPLPVDPSLKRQFGSARGPLVGSYGNIGSAYGVEFLAAVVKRLPEFRFLLMGQVLDDRQPKYKKAVDELQNSPNVVMTGRLREPDSLRFLRQCDVMLIPLPLTEQVRYSCPNRLWAFMGTGRPIVSTPIPEVSEFGDIVHVAENHEEFVDALRRAAGENDPNKMMKRIEVARMHTWPVLSQRIWSILANT